MKDEFEIYHEAMNLWGFELQAGVLAEECCELGKATLKLIRFINTWNDESNGELLENFIEEMVDVQIMINQFYHAFLDSDDKLRFLDFKNKKLRRVSEWIERDKNNE